MRRTWTWLSGSLLGLSLAAGCKHTQPQAEVEQCTDCTTTIVPMNPSPYQHPRLALVPGPQQPMPSTPPTVSPTNPAPLSLNPATPSLPNKLPAVTGEPVGPAPTVNPEQSAPPKSPWAMPHAESNVSAPAPTPATAPTPASMPAPVVMSGAAPQPAVAKKSVQTVAPTPAPAPVAVAPRPSAAPQYYNSPDYSILFGVLDYNARHGIWRLRYADAGDEDRFGGSVTLDGVGRQMNGYSSGDYVRVEGGFADPEATGASPAYRVKEMRPANGGR